MNCEVCGKDAELQETKISGATLQVCPTCGNYEPSQSTEDTTETDTKYSASTNSNSQQTQYDSTQNSNPPQELKLNYGDMIQNARNRNGLKISDLADRINEKENHIREIEQSNRQPTEDLRKKIEQELGIDLLE